MMRVGDAVAVTVIPEWACVGELVHVDGLLDKWKHRAGRIVHVLWRPTGTWALEFAVDFGDGQLVSALLEHLRRPS